MNAAYSQTNPMARVLSLRDFRDETGAVVGIDAGGRLFQRVTVTEA